MLNKMYGHQQFWMSMKEIFFGSMNLTIKQVISPKNIKPMLNKMYCIEIASIYLTGFSR